MKRAFIYIDGFNLYYGAVKGTPYKWLNINTLCEFLLPQTCRISALKYFTAIVSARGSDPNKPVRQGVFIRALETIHNLKVVLGHFRTHSVRLPLTKPVPGMPRTVDVLRTEEKGSDVNLACHLLNDAYLDKYDVAVVVSNDSDLAEALRIVREQMGKEVGLINPHKGQASKSLVQYANFVRSIRKGVLRLSQFPEVLHDSSGTFRKPMEW